jgi:hypothetical protein
MLTCAFGSAAAFPAVFFRFRGRESSSFAERLSALFFGVLPKCLNDDIQVIAGDKENEQVL